jgi:hypothetical protein
MTRAHALMVSAALAGCGMRTREGYPDVRGTYDGQFETKYTWVSDGHSLSGVPCLGTLVIDREEAGALGGTFLRGRPCVRSEGPLAGAVQRDGTLVLDLAGPSGFQDFDFCTYVEGARTWSGRAKGDELTAAIDVVLDCTDGRLRAERSLRVLTRPKS